MVYEKMCLEAYINNKYIWLKSDTGQLYYYGQPTYMFEFFAVA